MDFEACLFLKLPKLDRKAMIGMLAGSEVMDFERHAPTKCARRRC